LAFLADHTNGRTYATMLRSLRRLSSVVFKSVVCLSVCLSVLWLNGAS